MLVVLEVLDVLLEVLELADDAVLLLALLEALELEVVLELLEDAVAVGPTEHQAAVVNALPPVNSDCEQVKLPVNVAYTKVPAFPSATLCVPVIAQTEPTWAHFV